MLAVRTGGTAAFEVGKVVSCSDECRTVSLGVCGFPESCNACPEDLDYPAMSVEVSWSLSLSLLEGSVKLVVEAATDEVTWTGLCLVDSDSVKNIGLCSASAYGHRLGGARLIVNPINVLIPSDVN